MSIEFREQAKILAKIFHSLVMEYNENPDKEPLDKDQTEELSVMFREELDVLSGNLDKKELEELRGK